MGSANLGCGSSLQLKQLAADVIENDIFLEKATRHLRLTRKAAEIDHGACMGDGLGADWTCTGSVPVRCSY